MCRCMQKDNDFEFSSVLPFTEGSSSCRVINNQIIYVPPALKTKKKEKKINSVKICISCNLYSSKFYSSPWVVADSQKCSD